MSTSAFASYLEQLEQRHLADLRFSDVTRALRALSSTYVERRETALAAHKALDGAGKRAAFALYYGPLHFLLIDHIMRELGAPLPQGTIVDLGCGTGVAGTAIALRVLRSQAPADLRVLGIDSHAWAVDEARFTYQAFGLHGDPRRGHAAKTRWPHDTSIVVAAFVVNELNEADRAALLHQIKQSRASTLIVEPISLKISPWWDRWTDEFNQLGGRADVWKARLDAPPLVKRLAKAAGLRPELLTARSLYLPPRP